MKESNVLKWSDTKYYSEGPNKYKITVNISLDDDCKNMSPDWSVTGNISWNSMSGKWEWVSGGCIHEDILKHWPELKQFVDLHLCNFLGQPMYPIANGIYHIKRSLSVAKEYLRITDAEAAELYLASEEKDFFKYKLYKMGIVSRWKEESDRAIARLEEMTDTKWVNPYAEEELRVMRPDDVTEIEKRIVSGYYTESSIRERIEEKMRKEKEAQRQKVIDHCEKKCQEYIEERDVLLTVLDYGLPIDNVIYYNHSKMLSFNWLDYMDRISQEQFVDFVNNVDRSRLPEGIQFELK